MKFNVYVFLLFLMVTPIQASDCFRGLFAGRPQVPQIPALTPDKILQDTENNQPVQLITPADSTTIQALNYISLREDDRQRELEANRQNLLRKKELENQRKLAAIKRAENLEKMRIPTMIMVGEKLRKPVSARKLVSIKNQILPFLDSKARPSERDLCVILSYLESVLHKKNYCTPVDRGCWCVTETIKLLLCFPCLWCSGCEGFNPNCCKDYERFELVEYKNRYISSYQKDLRWHGSYLDGHDYCESYCGDTCAYYVEEDQVEPHQKLILDEIDSIIQKEANKRNVPVEASAIPSALMFPVQARVMSRNSISSPVDSRI
ncbi:MAG: hypothetical protein JO129_04495 [Candidatus Dependentiae bacterium]|nr:hypothetical protein [Candidatus Dependentiae bacterium]